MVPNAKMNRILDTHGCEFGRMIKKDLNFLIEKFDGGIENINKRLNKMDENYTILFNHNSDRVPKEVLKKLNRLHAILGSIAGGIAVAIVAVIIGKVLR